VICQKAFENVVCLNADDYEAQGSLGMQKGDAAQAEADLRAALKINPDESLARQNLERVLRASKR
jgi:Tfp pilus assembly protein PilF